MGQVEWPPPLVPPVPLVDPPPFDPLLPPLEPLLLELPMGPLLTLCGGDGCEPLAYIFQVHLR